MLPDCCETAPPDQTSHNSLPYASPTLDTPDEPHFHKQENEDAGFDGLTTHPHRDSSQIARILGKMGVSFITYSGHLAQIVLQRSGEALRDGDAGSDLQTFFFVLDR